MTINSKAPAEGGAGASQWNSLQVNNNKILLTIQPRLDLIETLKRYKTSLFSLSYDNHISRLVDCCDFIIDEVERGQHD